MLSTGRRARVAVTILALVATTTGTIRGAGRPAPPAALRVCADPNNLPFSNAEEQGFENALARLAARELGRTVEYTWWAQRRGFIRNTLNARTCDVVIGVPTDFEMAQTTRPYYRSTYVFVTRRDERPIASFDDPRLPSLRIGVHVIGDDYASVPPAQALAVRGMVQNVRGFSIYGDYGKPNPPATLIRAVGDGALDVAVAWGPLAGYFAARSNTPLVVTPAAPDVVRTKLPLAFDISMAVRRDDTALKRRLDDLIVRRSREIRAILERYHVPLVRSQARPQRH